MTTFAVGVDVGGTFTDAVAIAADGTVSAAKSPSTPADQSVGVLSALGALGVPAASVTRVAHGTTVVTNLLLERTGARVVLCATAGATDLLRLRRQDRASLYDLSVDHPAPLVAADDVVPVDERMGPSGDVLALSADAAARAAAAAHARGGDIAVVALLHAQHDGRHERAVANALRTADAALDVVCAHEVLPEPREFERTATAVAEAYARPRVATYLRALGGRLAGAGFPAPLVVTSSGGMLHAEIAAQRAASLALSGPAGGVVGAAAVCRAAGIQQALTLDIGGTSADAGVILDGEPMVEPGGDIAGVPIALPRVLVDTVSAGGGSVAWVDDGGALRVGPRSAGAVPGPACFGRGGTEATVTDAHVVLGTLRARGLAGGVSLDVAAAHAAVARVAAALRAAPHDVAAAMVATADAAMARALRRVSVERGIDPRQCTLVPFGGGGPLHACGVAAHVGMRSILVPPFAGVLSALGLALAPERCDGMAAVLANAEELGADAVAERIHRADIATGATHLPTRDAFARVRYAGQGHDVEVPVLEGDTGSAVAARFAAAHQARYGFVLERSAEVVAVRVVRRAAEREVTLARRATDGAGPSAWNADEPVDTGAPLTAVVHGPMSVALPDATLHVASGWTATALPIGGWHLIRDDA